MNGANEWNTHPIVYQTFFRSKSNITSDNIGRDTYYLCLTFKTKIFGNSCLPKVVSKPQCAQ